MNDPLADLWVSSPKEQPSDPLAGLWANEAPPKPQAQSVSDFESDLPAYANTEFSRGVARSGARMAGGLADFARVFVESPKLKKFADEMNSTAEQIPTKAASIKDVLNDPSLAPAYIGRVTGELAPQAVAAYLTGGLGKAAGSAAGLGSAGQRVAVGAGAALTSVPQEVGNMYRETEDLTGKGNAAAALAFGIPSGMLDALSAESIVGKVFRVPDKEVQRKAWRQIVRDTVKEIPKAAGMEGVTESMQESLALLADKSADHTFDLLTPDNGWRLLESAVAGALGGGLLGGGAELAALPSQKIDRNERASDLRTLRRARDSIRSRYDASAKAESASPSTADAPNQPLANPIVAQNENATQVDPSVQGQPAASTVNVENAQGAGKVSTPIAQGQANGEVVSPKPTTSPSSENTGGSEIESAVRDSNWRGTVRSVDAPSSWGLPKDAKLFIPVDTSGNDVAVNGQTILRKTPKEAIELAQKSVVEKPTTNPTESTTANQTVGQTILPAAEIAADQPKKGPNEEAIRQEKERLLNQPTTQPAAGSVSEPAVGGKQPWQMTQAEWRGHEARGTWSDFEDAPLVEARSNERLSNEALKAAQSDRAKLGPEERLLKITKDRDAVKLRNAERRSADSLVEQRTLEQRKASRRSARMATHEGFVKRAIERGEKVPSEVLAEYPDLLPQSASAIGRGVEQSAPASSTQPTALSPSEQSAERTGVNSPNEMESPSPDKKGDQENESLQREGVAKNTEQGGKILRASASEIEKILSVPDANAIASVSPNSTGNNGGNNRIEPGLRSGTTAGASAIPSAPRVLIETGTDSKAVGNIAKSENPGVEILANKLVRGTDNSVGSGTWGFNARLLEKLPGLRVAFRPDADPKSVAYYQNSNQTIFVDSNRVSANPPVELWGDVLAEELIHAAARRVAGTEEIVGVWKSLSPEEQAKVRELYPSGKSDFEFGSEYIRAVLQERLTGNVTERWRITNAMREWLRKLVSFLKDSFGAKPENNIARVVIERIEAAIRGDAAIRGSGPISDGAALRASLNRDYNSADYAKQQLGFWQKALDDARRFGTDIREPEIRVSEWERVLNERGASDVNRTSIADEVRSDRDEITTTEVFGVEDQVKGKTQWTADQEAKSRSIAKAVYDEAGLPVVDDSTFGQEGGRHWQLTDGKRDDAAGRRLVAAAKREFQKYGPSLETTELAQSLVLNFKTGRMNSLFSAPIRNELYALSQAERSFRGVLLNALRGAGEDVLFRSQNIDVVLNRIWGESYGGETISKVLGAIRDKLRVFLTPEVIAEVVKANSELAKVKDASKIISDGLATDFSNLNELRDTIADSLTKAGVEGKTANKLAKEIIEALKPQIRSNAARAAAEVEAGLKPEEIGVVKGKKPIWVKIIEMVQRGDFDNAIALREKARQNGWKPPSDEEIARIKTIAQRIEAMRELTKKEIDAAGGNKEKLSRERTVREQTTLPKQAELMRRLEAEWGKITRPVNFMRWFGSTRANNAAFVNELVSANLLLRLSFPFKQAYSIFGQFVTHVPTRAIGMALERHSQAKAQNRETDFRHDVFDSFGGSLKSAIAGYKDGIAQFVAAARGRGEARNVDRLMSGIAAIERIDAQAKQYAEEGKTGMAVLFRFFGLIRLGYRVAQAFDNLHGVPSEYVEMRNQVVMGLMRQGRGRPEAESQADNVITSIKASYMEALAEAKAFTDANGLEYSSETLREIAHRIARNWAYAKIRGLGLEDDFEAANKQLRETIGWNEREAQLGRGLGGAIGAGISEVGKFGEKLGLPLAVGRFSNAIAIGINRALHFTPLGFAPSAFGGDQNAWFKTELDRNQRKVEAAVGTSLGAVALMMALSGAFVVRLKWPKDPEERDMWERQGIRPGTVEIPLGNGKSTVFSMNTGLLTPLAPYLAAGGALNELLANRDKAQAKLNSDAAKKGLAPEKIRPMSVGDMMGVAVATAYQTVLGGRTSGGVVASATDYGTFNATKFVASQTAPLIPTLPAMQEISRMSGVVIDPKLATFTDFLLPLPTSPARRVNFLGDPAGTPDDVQRIYQTLSGGNYPLIDSDAAKEIKPYSLLFSTDVRPPSISANKGYAIGDTFRPFNDSELERYAVSRGQAYKEALSALPANADAKTVKAAMNEANLRALATMGVTVGASKIGSATRSLSRGSARPKFGRSRGLRSRGIRSLRNRRKGIRSRIRL